MIKINTTTDNFDIALARARAGDVIELEENAVYNTQGAWAFPDSGYLSLKSGVTLIAKNATIKLVNPIRTTGSNLRPDKDLPILRAGSDTVITGGKWDCNYEAHPGWFAQGIRFFGRFAIADSEILGMSGSRASGTPSNEVESFAISSEGDTSDSQIARVHVHSCKSDDPNDYVSGIFLGATQPTTKVSLIEGCRVYLGKYGQFGVSANTKVRIEDSEFVASRGFYNDTGPTDVVMVNCDLEGTYAAVEFVSKNAPAVRRQILLRNCSLTGERMLTWDDYTTKMTGFMVAEGCLFSGTYAAAIQGTGNIMLAKCQLPEDYKVALSGGSTSPTIF